MQLIALGQQQVTAFLLNVPETTASSHTSSSGSRIVLVQASSSVSFRLVLHPHAGAVSDEYNKQSSGNRQKNGRSKLTNSRFATRPLPRNPSTRPGRYDRITSTKLSMIAGAYKNYLPRVNRAISTPRSKYVVVIGARDDLSACKFKLQNIKAHRVGTNATFQNLPAAIQAEDHLGPSDDPIPTADVFLVVYWEQANKLLCNNRRNKLTHCSSILRSHTGPTSSFNQGWLTIPDHDFRSGLRHC